MEPLRSERILTFHVHCLDIRDGDLGIERSNGGAHIGYKTCWAGPCPHRQVQVAEPVKRRIDESTLGRRQVGRIVVQLCVFGDSRVFYVTHNAVEHVSYTSEIDKLTEGIPS